MSEGKKIVEDSTYFGSEDFMNAARKAGHKPDGQAVVVHGPQLAGVIDRSLSYARRAELKLIQVELANATDLDHAKRLVGLRLAELEWGKNLDDARERKFVDIVRPADVHVNGKIEAIRQWRRHTGDSLVEAKNAIESIYANDGPVTFGIDFSKGDDAGYTVFAHVMGSLGFDVSIHGVGHNPPKLGEDDNTIFHVETPK